MLEPLFPEIAGMSVSSDGLIEAIHGCELRLVHAHEAVLVSGVHSVSESGSSQSNGLQGTCCNTTFTGLPFATCRTAEFRDCESIVKETWSNIAQISCQQYM